MKCVSAWRGVAGWRVVSLEKRGSAAAGRCFVLDGVTHYQVLALKTPAQQVLFGSRALPPTLKVVTLAAAAEKNTFAR